MSIVTPSPVLALRHSRFGLSLPVILGLLVYAKALATGGTVIGDADTFWHIAVGQWIITHGAVPWSEVFSYSMPGASFTPPEWLAEVVMAWLYDRFGWPGIEVATALSVAAALALLLRVLLRTLAPVPALIAAMLAWGTALTHLLARPDIFTLPILVAWVAALVAARSEDRAPSLWLAPLMALWANLHSSYMLGLGLAALLAGEALLLAPTWPSRVRAARAWTLFGAASVAAALVTPFGFAGLLLPFKLIGMNFSLAVLGEWQSPNFQKFQPLELSIMVLMFAALALGWRLPWPRVAVVLLLVHMALQHLRHDELLGVAAPLLLAPALPSRFKAGAANRSEGSVDRSLAELARPASLRGIALAGLVLVALSAALLRNVSTEPAVPTPSAALAVAAAQGIKGPVLNDYEFGGYLILRGQKPFIDGRYLYGDALIQRYVEATAVLTDGLPDLLRDYGITWTLLKAGSPATVLLDHMPGWRRLYADDTAVVHVRDDQAQASGPAR
jgi:hypothetical protein